MYYEKGKLRDISCKMRDAGFDISFRDCPAKGGTGGHPNHSPPYEKQLLTDVATVLQCTQTASTNFILVYFLLMYSSAVALLLSLFLVIR
jgi:hypothetical protein